MLYQAELRSEPSTLWSRPAGVQSEIRGTRSADHTLAVLRNDAMAAHKWISPMLKGRGLKTINALPPKPSLKQTVSPLAGQAGPHGLSKKTSAGPRWNVPGYELLSRADLLRR